MISTMANKITKINRFYSLVLICLVSMACNKSKLSPEEYVKWIDSDKNGLVKTKEINGYQITSKLVPAEYIAVKETYAENKKFDAPTYNKKVKELGSQYYIYMQLKPLNGNKSALRNDIGSADDYYYRIEYFNFMSEKDVYLVANTDTLKCALSNFENNYEITPFNNWQLVFEKPAKPLKEDLKFVWDDQALGIGRVRFSYDIDDINNIPTISF